MDITRLRFRNYHNKTKVAVCEVVFDESFIIKDIAIRQGKGGLYVTYPIRQYARNRSKDVAHPVTKEFSEEISNTILAKYGVYKETGIDEFFVEDLVG